MKDKKKLKNNIIIFMILIIMTILYCIIVANFNQDNEINVINEIRTTAP